MQSLSVERYKEEIALPIHAMVIVIYSSWQRRKQLQNASIGELVRCGQDPSF
jgi:hypothetical protein